MIPTNWEAGINVQSTLVTTLQRKWKLLIKVNPVGHLKEGQLRKLLPH